jgi:hypothetical protein
MDRDTLNEMVKLKFGARKAGGPDIDLVKLAADARYADVTLSLVENLPDESLVLLAMTLRDKFGLLSAKPTQVIAMSEPVMEKPAAPVQRYIGGARG